MVSSCSQLSVCTPEWSGAEPLQLRGKCLDLESAYKQLARAEADAACSVIAVWNPSDSRWAYFLAVALPFGALASVYALNRAARALRDAAASLLEVAVVNYFDDYPVLETERLAASTQASLLEFFESLGWEVALEDKKNKPFSAVFQALGVELDLSRCPEGVCLVQNRPDRVEDLLTTVRKAKQALPCRGGVPQRASSVR
jgi:hypothetical protein